MQGAIEEESHTIVAECRDTGTQLTSFESTVSHNSIVDGTWVIAIAAGIDNRTQPEQAAETAIATIPEQINSKREMYTALARAHDEVVALGPAWSLQDSPDMADYSAVSLCVAAWSPLGGLVVGWAGDSIAIGIWQDEEERIRSAVISQPHIRPDGLLTKVLGQHIPTCMLPDGVAPLADVVTDVELDLPSDGFSIALLSAGVWQSLVPSWSASDQALSSHRLAGSLASVVANGLADAKALAASIRDHVRQSNSEDTITATVARVTADAQQGRQDLYARSKYSEHDVFDTPPLDTILWRYMDFPKFVSILEESALFFTRLDLMDDPFEGARSSFNREVRPVIYGDEVSELIFRDLDAASHRERKRIYLSCWSQGEHESEALWARYSSRDNGIAIRTTCAKLIASLTCDVTSYVAAVSYVDYNSTFIPENNLFSPIVYKRREFEYEQEVRIVQKRGGYGASDGALGDESSIPGVYQQVDLPLLIDEVRVAPNAQPWFLDLVRASCARIGLDVQVVMSSLADRPDL